MASYASARDVENMPVEKPGVTTRAAARRGLSALSTNQQLAPGGKPQRAAPAAAAGGGAAAGAELAADRRDRHDPRAMVEVVNDMHDYHRSVEASKAVQHNYMTHQGDVNHKMRAILVDWLVEVHLKFKLEPETLFLTTYLIDRYLEKKSVVRQRLQLVGVTAMLIASKYEEIYAPEVRDFVYITDRAYTREQILDMETDMLNKLGFKITAPTAYNFVNRFCRVAGLDKRSRSFVFYLVERTLQEYRFLRYSPSMVAAAALNIAVRSLSVCGGRWAGELAEYTRYTEAELRPCITDIQQCLANDTAHATKPNALLAVRKKYMSSKFDHVADMRVVELPAE